MSVASLVEGGTPLSAIVAAIPRPVGRRIGVGWENPLTLESETQAKAPKTAVDKDNFMMYYITDSIACEENRRQNECDDEDMKHRLSLAKPKKKVATKSNPPQVEVRFYV